MKEERFTLSLSKGYNILEACRHHPVEHLVYASSSSVYGGNRRQAESSTKRLAA
jgi:nucleoside-diphosphate-sugar epimerase